MRDGANEVQVNLDFAGLRNGFLSDLQRLLDVAGLVECAIANVTERQVALHPAKLVSVSTWPEGKLSFEDARERASSLVLPGFFRDAIASAERFVAECLYMLELIDITAAPDIDMRIVRRLSNRVDAPSQLLHANFKANVDRLERALGGALTFSSKVDALRRARNCIVHNGGVVSSKHANKGECLAVPMRTVQLIAKDAVTGDETVLTSTRVSTANGAIVTQVITDVEKLFHIGDEIRLGDDDLVGCVLTLCLFGIQAVEGLEGYAQNNGIVDGLVGNQKPIRRT